MADLLLLILRRLLEIIATFHNLLQSASNEGRAAVIGDNVYIGPNTCIVEDVNIGNNATIGAGSVVTKDIPSNATAAGNYAKVLNFNNPGRYVENRWPCMSGGQNY